MIKYRRVRGWLARNAPLVNTFEIAAIRRSLGTQEKRRSVLRRELTANPGADEDSLRTEIDAVADALRPGTRAAVQEIALTRRPWPFPLSEVTAPVHIWHGALDRSTPLAFALRLARELPDATLHVSDTSGHDVGADRSAEITSVLAAACLS